MWLFVKAQHRCHGRHIARRLKTISTPGAYCDAHWSMGFNTPSHEAELSGGTTTRLCIVSILRHVFIITAWSLITDIALPEVSIFPVYHYFRSLCALVCVVVCVRLSILFCSTRLCAFIILFPYYSSIQLLSCKCVFIKLLCSVF